MRSTFRSSAGPAEPGCNICERTCGHHASSQDPLYLLFSVLTAVITPHWVLVSNAERYWSSGTQSIFPTILRNRVLDFTVAVPARKAPPVPEASLGRLPCNTLRFWWRSAPTLHPFLGAAGSMQLRRSTTRQSSDCHRTAGSVAAPHTILRKLHEQRLFTAQKDCTHDPHTIRHTSMPPVCLRKNAVQATH